MGENNDKPTNGQQATAADNSTVTQLRGHGNIIGGVHYHLPSVVDPGAVADLAGKGDSTALEVMDKRSAGRDGDSDVPQTDQQEEPDRTWMHVVVSGPGCLKCNGCRDLLQMLVHDYYEVDQYVDHLDTIHDALPTLVHTNVKEAYDELREFLTERRASVLVCLEGMTGIEEAKLLEYLEAGWELPGDWDVMIRLTYHEIVDFVEMMPDRLVPTKGCPYRE